MFRTVKNLILIVAAIYCGVIAYYTYYQRDMIYHPSGEAVSPDKAGAPSSFVEVGVVTEDGLNLKGWYSPPTSKNVTIVFFHGNADYLKNIVYVAEPYVNAGYGFLLAEYRGYSMLPGRPSENGLYADARAYVMKAVDLGSDIAHIVVMGHSLGTGVAVQMASEFNPAGLVLIAPFTSITALANAEYPFLPIDFMLFDHFASEHKIGHLPNTPVMIVHGSDDDVVPLAQGRKLFDLAKDPKVFRLMEGRSHSDLFEQAVVPVSDFIEMYVR